MTFINEAYVSAAGAQVKIEEIQGEIAALVEKAQDAERELSLAAAAAEQIAGYAQATGIEDDMERAEVLTNEIRETQEYISAAAGKCEEIAEVVEASRQKAEALTGLVESMGGHA